VNNFEGHKSLRVDRLTLDSGAVLCGLDRNCTPVSARRSGDPGSAARSAEGAYARGLRDTASGWAIAPGPPVIGRALHPRKILPLQLNYTPKTPSPGTGCTL
jgi:hypothetical protein